MKGLFLVRMFFVLIVSKRIRRVVRDICFIEYLFFARCITYIFLLNLLKITMRYYCLPFADEEMRIEKLKQFPNHNVSNCPRRDSNPNVSVSKIFVFSTKPWCPYIFMWRYREEKGVVEERRLRLFIFNLESLH